MPFGKIKLNDGRHLPEIGFGSWLIGSGQTVVEQVRLPPSVRRGKLMLRTRRRSRRSRWGSTISVSLGATT